VYGKKEEIMPSITKFEDIHAWQAARRLVSMVYKLTDSGNLARDFGMRDQIRRAAISAMSNIAEGFDCDSKAEFARFLGIARRSAVEVQSLLYAGLDIGHISNLQFHEHFAQAQKTKALIGGFKSSLKRSA
jgi:four helix bundle protein